MTRPKLNRKKLQVRVAENTISTMNNIAYKFGYIYDNKGSVGKLLDAISSGEVTLTKTLKVDVT